LTGLCLPGPKGAHVGVLLDLLERGRVKGAGVALEVLDVEDLVDALGVLAVLAALVDAVDPRDVALRGDALLQRDNVAVGHDLGGLRRALLAGRSAEGGDDGPGEEGEVLEADHYGG